jgi:hypothetical protein
MPAGASLVALVALWRRKEKNKKKCPKVDEHTSQQSLLYQVTYNSNSAHAVSRKASCRKETGLVTLDLEITGNSLTCPSTPFVKEELSSN